VWQLGAFTLSAVASLLLVFLPAFSSSSESSTSAGVEQTRTTTLLEEQGPAILITLAVPVVLTLLPLLLRGRGPARRAVSVLCTVMLGAGTLLALLSVGAFYLPALVCAIAAATAAVREPATEPVG
jgi:hypothetical protein